jgi:hypothetical protein
LTGKCDTGIFNTRKYGKIEKIRVDTKKCDEGITGKYGEV